MKIIYVAEDGKQFDNEKDCIKYEGELIAAELRARWEFFEEGN